MKVAGTIKPWLRDKRNHYKVTEENGGRPKGFTKENNPEFLLYFKGHNNLHWIIYYYNHC